MPCLQRQREAPHPYSFRRSKQGDRRHLRVQDERVPPRPRRDQRHPLQTLLQHGGEEEIKNDSEFSSFGHLVVGEATLTKR